MASSSICLIPLHRPPDIRLQQHHASLASPLFFVDHSRYWVSPRPKISMSHPTSERRLPTGLRPPARQHCPNAPQCRPRRSYSDPDAVSHLLGAVIDRVSGTDGLVVSHPAWVLFWLRSRRFWCRHEIGLHSQAAGLHMRVSSGFVAEYSAMLVEGDQAMRWYSRDFFLVGGLGGEGV
jgi:hypothetical protein